MSNKFSLALLLILAVLAPRALAQESLIQNLLKGTTAPNTYEVKDLPDNFQAITLGLNSDLVNNLRYMLGSMSMPGYDSSRGEYLSAYWTDGKEVIDPQGARYLVAYTALGASPAEMNSLPRGFDQGGSSVKGTDIDQPTPKLRLVLIRESKINSITPRPDLTKAGWLSLYGGNNPNFPQTNNSNRVNAALSNLKQAELAVMMYSGDSDDVLPWANDSTTAIHEVYPYVKSNDIFKSLNPNGGSIRYNVHLSGVSMESIESPTDTVVWYDSLPWPGGLRLAAFADGHAKFIKPEDWPKYQVSIDRRYPPVGSPPVPIPPQPKPKPKLKPDRK